MYVYCYILSSDMCKMVDQNHAITNIFFILIMFYYSYK